MAFIAPLASNAAELLKFDAYCDQTDTIVKNLKETYKEAPIIIGKASDEAKSVMTVWTNPTTKSWTIVATKSNISCIIGVGDGFTIIKLPKTTI
jgi:hypothetical protein